MIDSALSMQIVALIMRQGLCRYQRRQWQTETRPRRKRLDMKKHYYRQLNSKGYVFRYYSESYAKFLNDVYGYNFELVAVTFKFAKD